MSARTSGTMVPIWCCHKTPDFALVLTPEGGIYVPETILPIKGAYQNARLIAMPDEAWLRPDTLVGTDDSDAA